MRRLRDYRAAAARCFFRSASPTARRSWGVRLIPALTEPLFGRGVEEGVSLAQDAGHARGKFVVAERADERGFVEAARVVAGEPMAGISVEQIIAHLAPVGQVEAARVVPETRDFLHVHLA